MLQLLLAYSPKKTPGKHENLPTALGALRLIMSRQPHLILHAYLLKQKCLIMFNNRSKIVYRPWAFLLAAQTEYRPDAEMIVATSAVEDHTAPSLA